MAGVGGVTGKEATRMLTEDPCPTRGLEIFSQEVRAGRGSPADSEDRRDGFGVGSVALTRAVVSLATHSSLPSSKYHVSWSLKQWNSPTRQK